MLNVRLGLQTTYIKYKFDHWSKNDLNFFKPLTKLSIIKIILVSIQVRLYKTFGSIVYYTKMSTYVWIEYPIKTTFIWCFKNVFNEHLRNIKMRRRDSLCVVLIIHGSRGRQKTWKRKKKNMLICSEKCRIVSNHVWM